MDGKSTRELKHVASIKAVTHLELAHCHFLPYASGQTKSYGVLHIHCVGGETPPTPASTGKDGERRRNCGQMAPFTEQLITEGNT